MKDSQGNLVLGRTRWRRFAVVLLPAALLGAGLMAGVANGAVPIHLNVSGDIFKVQADSLDGQGFAQYPGVVRKTEGGQFIPVAVSAIDFATIKNLCQSVRLETPLGPVSLIITGGQGDKKVTADDLLIGLDQLAGDATFTNITIGTDASVLSKGGPNKGSLGDFGQEADRIVINNLKQTAYSTQAGTFTVEGLHLRVAGGEECFTTIP